MIGADLWTQTCYPNMIESLGIESAQVLTTFPLERFNIAHCKMIV